MEKGLGTHTRGQTPLPELPLGFPCIPCVLPTTPSVGQGGAQKLLLAAHLQGEEENSDFLNPELSSRFVHGPVPHFILRKLENVLMGG